MSSEKLVQDEFERCLESICKNSEMLPMLKSWSKENAYVAPSFAGRKPDLVNHEKGCTGSIAITFFGDCKKRGKDTDGNFTDEQIGHILDMSRVFMEKVGYYCQKLLTFLTDGKRWQFFVTQRSRDDNGFHYKVSKVIDDSQNGWNILWTLLQQDLSTLGYCEPKIEGVVLKDPLRRGSSSSVYEGTWNGERVVIKVFLCTKASSFEAEQRAMKVLKDVDCVPKILHIGTVAEPQRFQLHDKALILTPVAKVLRTDKCRTGEPVDGRDMRMLVETVQKAHKHNILHRDIKPDNYFLHDNTFILNDWGSSRLTSEAKLWEGSIGFSVSPEQQRDERWNDKAYDLVAVVRTAFVCFCKESPPVDDHEKAIRYWNTKFRGGSGLHAAIEHAINTDYDELAKTLHYLK